MAEQKPGGKPEIPMFLRSPPGEPGAVPGFLKPETGASADASAKPVAPAAEKPATESAAAIFEQMVSGIRRNREQHERKQQEQHSRLDADWRQVLESMRELQRKVQGHRNLVYFTISRDGQEISIKIVDYGVRSGFSIYTLARHHPEHKHQGLDAVWLLEFPDRETFYRDAKEAMAELVARVAGALA